MQILNRHTGKLEAIELKDILYTYYEGDREQRKYQKTWSFRCQGFLQIGKHDYIIGPGNQVYILGTNCFTTSSECLSMEQNNEHDEDKYKVVVIKMPKEQQIKI